MHPIKKRYDWFREVTETRGESLRRQAEGMEREADMLIARAERLRKNAQMCRNELAAITAA